MRTKLEGEEAPRSADRKDEASFTQNAHNTPSMTPELSDTKQEPDNLSGDTAHNLTNPISIAGEEHQDKWIKGIPLLMVTSGITLVIFLMLLDMSILSTVCHPA